jgi:hypothetical protein
MASVHLFDVESLRMPYPHANGIGRRAKPTSPLRPRQGGRFLKGPIPWPWLEAAVSLPGKAVVVLALCLWHEAGLQKQKTFSVNLSRVGLPGVGRFTACRALKHLERAGLVAVRRKPGRKAELTILNIEES